MDPTTEDPKQLRDLRNSTSEFTEVGGRRKPNVKKQREFGVLNLSLDCRTGLS